MMKTLINYQVATMNYQKKVYKITKKLLIKKEKDNEFFYLAINMNQIKFKT